MGYKLSIRLWITVKKANFKGMKQRRPSKRSLEAISKGEQLGFCWVPSIIHDHTVLSHGHGI